MKNDDIYPIAVTANELHMLVVAKFEGFLNLSSFPILLAKKGGPVSSCLFRTVITHLVAGLMMKIFERTGKQAIVQKISSLKLPTKRS